MRNSIVINFDKVFASSHLACENFPQNWKTTPFNVWMKGEHHDFHTSQTAFFSQSAVWRSIALVPHELLLNFDKVFETSLTCVNFPKKLENMAGVVSIKRGHLYWWIILSRGQNVVEHWSLNWVKMCGKDRISYYFSWFFVRVWNIHIDRSSTIRFTNCLGLI